MHHFTIWYIPPSDVHSNAAQVRLLTRWYRVIEMAANSLSTWSGYQVQLSLLENTWPLNAAIDHYRVFKQPGVPPPILSSHNCAWLARELEQDLKEFARDPHFLIPFFFPQDLSVCVCVPGLCTFYCIRFASNWVFSLFACNHSHWKMTDAPHTTTHPHPLLSEYRITQKFTVLPATAH